MTITTQGLLRTCDVCGVQDTAAHHSYRRPDGGWNERHFACCAELGCYPDVPAHQRCQREAA